MKDEFINIFGMEMIGKMLFYFYNLFLSVKMYNNIYDSDIFLVESLL